MRKNVLLYIIAFMLLVTVLLFFNKAYRELNTYSELTNKQNNVYSCFQKISVQIHNAAVINPGLVKVYKGKNEANVFFTDSLKVIGKLDTLRSVVRDSINVRIVQELDPTIRSELSWILKSNVPDSIAQNRSPQHIAAFQRIDLLINKGIQRTNFLIAYRKAQLNEEITSLKVWMIFFILLSGALLSYTTFNLFRQQNKTKRKEKELEIVFNRISDGVVSVDKDWRYSFLNDAAMFTHPFGKEETLGKIIWDVHPEMKGTIFWDKYHEALRTKKVQEIESYYAPMNTWFSVKVYPSDDGLTIFYKDITESKRAEQRLSASLKEITDYKLALDESSIVAITDQKGIITHANNNFCKISKYSVEELIGQDHRLINSGHHPKSFIKDLWVTIANGKIWRGELKNKAKDGTIYWVDTTIVPFLNEEGKPYQYVAIRADITERKQAEEDLIKAQYDIVKLNRDLEEKIIKRTEQLNQSNKELENFSYSVSHDLRAPLRIIDGFGQILMEDYAAKLDADGQDAVNVIMRNARKMGQLIDDLLNFSKVGKTELRVSGVDMTNLVEEVLADLQQGGIAIPAGLQLHKLKTAKGDNNLLKQVWVNLISNAIKYSGGREQPVIEIGMMKKEEDDVYYIKDNGAGFDMKYADKLFGVFQRLHKANEFSGTGVGLALAQRIILRHGGNIWAEAKLNEGATFYFTLDH